MALGLEIEGAYGPETFEGGVRGVWLAPQASLRLPSVRGRVTLWVMAPRPTPAVMEISVMGEVARDQLAVDQRLIPLTVEITSQAAAADSLDLEITSTPYRPAANGGSDQRVLGVVLASVSFEPAGSRP
jgi:hypothetical protein